MAYHQGLIFIPQSWDGGRRAGWLSRYTPILHKHAVRLEFFKAPAQPLTNCCASILPRWWVAVAGQAGKNEYSRPGLFDRWRQN